MTDTFLLRMTEEIVGALRHSNGESPATELIPSYNAVLTGAKSNHPSDPFLLCLTPLEKNNFINIAQLLALFAQVRIVMESFQEPPDA